MDILDEARGVVNDAYESISVPDGPIRPVLGRMYYIRVAGKDFCYCGPAKAIRRNSDGSTHYEFTMFRPKVVEIVREMGEEEAGGG